MKKFKTRHFVHFQLRAKYWMEFFGIKDWEVIFTFKEKNDNYRASVQYNYFARRATVNLTPTIIIEECKFIKIYDYLDKCAFHEILHLAMAELMSVSTKKYTTKDEIDTAEEKFVTLMENILWEGMR